MLTLIGSAAAKSHFPDFRQPTDIDWHTADASEIRFHMTLADDVFVDERLGQWDWGRVATPEELYTMKVSHAFWEIGNSWRKHINDVVFFQRKGVEFNRDLYDILFPIWKDLHGKKRTSLAQNSKNFFGDAVKRKYDHDSVHASIAYLDHPLYEDILVPGEEVMVDSDKFWAMDHETKKMLVREEIYATALERILIANDYTTSPTGAYAWAMQRTITSLFKGEWALWLVLHYDELAMPDCDYVARHLSNQHKLIKL